MKCCVINLGCKVNAYESEYIKEKFREKNYKIVPLTDNPNIIVINTCTVTNQSDSKSRKMIRLAKKTNPNAILFLVLFLNDLLNLNKTYNAIKDIIIIIHRWLFNILQATP